MYKSLREGYFRHWKASRYLGLATSLLAFYVAKHYIDSRGRSCDMYDRVLTAELFQNSVLSFVRAAHVGAAYQKLSDHVQY